MVRLVDAFPILGRLGRQAELLVQLPPQLLELCQALAEIVVLEVATRLRILILAIRILVEVDALEVVEIQVVDVRVDVAGNLATLIRRQGQRRQGLGFWKQPVAVRINHVPSVTLRAMDAVAKPTLFGHGSLRLNVLLIQMIKTREQAALFLAELH